jgi:hypothetical protein
MRSLLSGLTRFIASICLSLAVGLTLFHLTIGNQARVEKWISGDETNSALKNYFVENSGATGPGKLALSSALQPELIHDNLGGITKTIFDWLNGKTKGPYYAVDLGKFNKSYQDNLLGSLQSKVLALPVCPTATLPNEIDQSYLEGLACNPFGPKEQVSGLFDAARATTDNTKIELKSGPGSLFEKLSWAPKYFQLSRTFIPVVWVGFILSSLATLFITKNKREYVRHFGMKLIFSGGSLLLSAGLLKLQSSGKLSGKLGGADKLVETLTKSASGDLMLIFGVLGAGLFVTGLALRLGAGFGKSRGAVSQPLQSAQGSPAQGRSELDYRNPAADHTV